MKFKFNIVHSVIVVVFTLLLSTTFIQAQQEATKAATPSASSSYQLPYPGILPDHPLWLLKAARDRIMSILIADPLKKAEFDIFQADKRLVAGVALVQKGKGELGLSTISKGENYFEDAVDRIRDAKRSGKNTTALADRVLLASKKHNEVLTDIEKISGNGIGEGIRKEKLRLGKFEKEVSELK